MFGFGLSRYISEAKVFISEAMAAAKLTDDPIDTFLPDEKQVRRVARICKRNGLSAQDCGLALIDAGYEFAEKVRVPTVLGQMRGAARPETADALGSLASAFLQEQLEKHDRLLERAWQVGTTHYGLKTAPRNGSIGKLLSERLGEYLIDAK